jgi:hypothetical protein
MSRKKKHNKKTNQTPDPAYIERLRLHERKSLENAEYAVTRLDILTISLSTGGIFLVFEIAKELIDQKALNWLVIIAVAFPLTIIVNLISQWTSYKENGLSAELAKNTSRFKRGKPLTLDLDELTCDLNNYRKWTNALNKISYLLLCIGIAGVTTIIIIYTLKN